ncbi:hypothetical protein L6164_033141 [Bauhinia variegata]|uniref:Uncharacterized protein n=1 Tax=Bauhinia variegata TaxID=167791 RepID=A0ACB9KQT4_BAUVA|nr:hypothetical protein L6164_033141 [Bauhinia variegata]
MANYSQAHICQCLRRLFTSRRNFPVTISSNRRRTGEEFVTEVLGLACGLIELGIRAGDVVAISAYNSDWYLEWLLAIAFVGGIAAPLNYRWSFEEAKLAMTAVRPAMLVTDESCYMWYLNLQKNDIPTLRWHVLLGSPSSEFIKWNALTPEMLKRPPVKPLSFDYSWAPEGAVIICFTSGSTGKPKGVTLSHGAFIVQSLAKIAIVGYSEDDIYLHTAPLCHIGGLSSAMAMLMVGGCHVLMPKFDAQSAVEAIEQYTVTSLITVPAILVDMILLIRKKGAWKGGETVKRILNGGGSLSVELIKDASIFFHKAKLISAYGMTETCSSLTFQTLYDPTHDTTSQHLHVVDKTTSDLHHPQGVCLGKAAPHVELKLCVDDSGHTGKILTRGPHIMIGYWGQIPINSSDHMNEVWLDTGDIGLIDHHGNLWLIGRANTRIKSGGENIYPEEVEAILLEHPGITGAVIVGIPDARLTEMVVACIRLREDWQWSEQSVSDKELHLSREHLHQYCMEKKLTRFKIPKIFILRRKPFPLTTTGKLRRHQIQKEVIAQLRSLHSNL